MKQHKDVLVLALSSFPKKQPMNLTTYKYKETINQDKKVKRIELTYYGYYQLTPIPRFLKDYLERDLTDVILLETNEVKNSVDIQFASSDDRYEQVKEEYEIIQENNHISPVKYFEEYIKNLYSDHIVFHHISLDEYHLDQALSDVLTEIDAIYEEFINLRQRDGWGLWFDTHGAFRDISTVLASAVRFLATRETTPISTNGIFTVYHHQNDDPDVIQNQTGFYLANSQETLKRFLNYGQYLVDKFVPYEGSENFCFISYRHDPHYLSYIRTLFQVFNNKNINYWFDDCLKTGEQWDKQLHEKVKQAKVFIILMTNSYFQSTECWKELLRAMKHQKKDPSYTITFVILDEFKTKDTLSKVESDFLYTPAFIGDHRPLSDHDPNAQQKEDEFKEKIKNLKRKSQITDQEFQELMNHAHADHILNISCYMNRTHTDINARTADQILDKDVQYIKDALKK